MRLRKNIGTPDRIFRLITAVIFLGLAYWKSSWIFLGISIFIFLEALFSWCIIYQLLGKDSCDL